MMQLSKIRIVLILLGITLLVSACSIKTAYRQLDWVLAGMVEDYVDLSDAQEDNVDKRIAAFLQWHQFTQLGTYADDLQQVKNYTSKGLDDSGAEDIFNRVMTRWEAIKKRVAPEMADMFLSLNDKQTKQLFERLAEQNEEIQEEFDEYTLSERYERGGEKMIENFERWLGDLSDQQEQFLKTWPPKFKLLHEDRMAFRLKWQASLNSLLHEPLSAEERRVKLIELISRPDVYQTEGHKQKLVYNSKQFKSLILSFDETVTQAQRAYLGERIDNLITNFRELAAEKTSE